jgi:hypothetical protein
MITHEALEHLQKVIDIDEKSIKEHQELWEEITKRDQVAQFYTIHRTYMDLQFMKMAKEIELNTKLLNSIIQKLENEE